MLSSKPVAPAYDAVGRLLKTLPSLHAITENLARAQQHLLSAAGTIPPEHWSMRPGEGRWSAAELVCHLILVERTIIKNADRLLQSPPRPRAFLKRFHLPMALVEARLIRRKTPIPLDPALLCEKEAMLGQLSEVRQRTLSFMEGTHDRNLAQYHWPHPFLGTLNMYEWFQMIASHEVRHAKQMKEISLALPKTVTALH